LPDPAAARSWDDEYRRGRYAAEPPLPFVHTIVDVLRRSPLGPVATGLYVGCGNGRNFVPLLDAGLRLWGLDVSSEALHQLATRRPGAAEWLRHADFVDWQPPAPLAYVIAIQVFQHGRQADVARYFANTVGLLPPGGLFFLRVNSASTEVYHRHAVVERGPDGAFTVEYLDGPKQGLAVHFYSRAELDALTGPAFGCVQAPHELTVHRAPPKHGSWTQWEAVYVKR
jgi:trans-aconitate methyltransferase